MSQLYPDPYGPPWKLPWLRMMLQWQGGILQMFLLEWLVNVAICALVVTAVYFAWKDNPEELSHNWYSLIEATLFVARRFQAAMALMLGFYSMQNFTRWREVRNMEGNAMGNINDLALQIAWRIRDCIHRNNNKSEDESESKSGENGDLDASNGDGTRGICDDDRRSKSVGDATIVRLKLIRWLNLSHALVVGDVYEGRNEFSSLDNLVKYGLATKDECEFLQQQDTRYKYVAPFLWFMDLIDDFQKNENFGVNEGVYNLMATGVVGIRRNLIDLYALKLTPIPLSYKQLTNMTVRMYMAILVLGAATQEKADVENYGQLSRGSFWIIMVYAFEYFLYVGWLTVADALGNPFRAWPDQLDWDKYVKELNLSSWLIGSRFRGAAAPEDKADEDEEDDEALGKLESTCRTWEKSLKHPDEAAAKGWRAKRKLLTGW